MNTTTLRKVGGSVMLKVPPALLDVLQLAPGAQVGLLVDNGRLVVEPRPKPRYSMTELLAEAEATGAYADPSPDREWLDTPAAGEELL